MMRTFDVQFEDAKHRVCLRTDDARKEQLTIYLSVSQAILLRDALIQMPLATQTTPKKKGGARR